MISVLDRSSIEYPFRKDSPSIKLTLYVKKMKEMIADRDLNKGKKSSAEKDSHPPPNDFQLMIPE